MAWRTSVNASFYVYQNWDSHGMTPRRGRFAGLSTVVSPSSNTAWYFETANPTRNLRPSCVKSLNKIDQVSTNVRTVAYRSGGLQSLRKENSSLRIIVSNHSTQVTIQHSGVPPFTDQLPSTCWPRVWRYSRSLR